MGLDPRDLDGINRLMALAMGAECALNLLEAEEKEKQARRATFAEARKERLSRPFRLNDAAWEVNSENNFRFRPDEIRRLWEVLEFPEHCRVTTRPARHLPRETVFCLGLYQLAHDEDHAGLAHMFSLTKANVQRALSFFFSHVFNNFAWRLTADANTAINYGHVSSRVDEWKNGISRASEENWQLPAWGLVDGTTFSIQRPAKLTFDGAKKYWDGHHSNYEENYLGLVTPDGMCRQLYGPMPGARADSYLFDMSGLKAFNEKLNRDRANLALRRNEAAPARVCFLGDMGFGRSADMLVPYKRPKKCQLARREKRANKAVARARIGVEWWFGHLKEAFPLSARERRLSCEVSARYIPAVAALFCNFRTILRAGIGGGGPNGGSHLSGYYGVQGPETLNEYVLFLRSRPSREEYLTLME